MSIKKVTWPMTMKKNYIMVGTVDGRYRKCNNAQRDCIGLLYMLFTDHGTDVDWLLRRLVDPDSTGVTAELIEVFIDGGRIILQPSILMRDNPEDYAIEMDRDELIHLAHEWKELIDKKVAPIYIYYKDGKYGVSDILPEGVE